MDAPSVSFPAAKMDILFPVYQHPTTTVLIDDSRSFLDSLAFQLNPTLTCEVFHDIRPALASLRQAFSQPSGHSLAIRVDYDEHTLNFERRTVAVDLDLIYRQVMNPKRFCLPSVLVIDYAMPQMDGVTFCQVIQDLPCKKILFTGQADEKIAIDAFNRGLIDRFIKKGDNDALDCLETEIRTLQKAFFVDQSRTLKDLLARHSFAFLCDPAISTLVSQLCTRYGFIEYYLFPNPSGILFFDKQGKGTLMVIETEAGLISQFEAALDHQAPPELLEALQKLSVVPFFSDSGGMYAGPAAHDWLSYCLPARTCKGKQDYYWALFDLPQHYLPGSIHAYADFLQK